MYVIVFDGEQVNGETGETEPVNGWTREQVVRRVRTMGEGDALVINARQEDRS